MIDFESHFEGLTINGRAKAALKAKATAKPKVTVKAPVKPVLRPALGASARVSGRVQARPSVATGNASARQASASATVRAQAPARPKATAAGSIAAKLGIASPTQALKVAPRLSLSPFTSKPPSKPSTTLKSQIASPAINMAVSLAGGKTVSPEMVKDAAKTIKERVAMAAKIASKPLMSLAKKAPATPAPHTTQLHEKAIAAVQPIAQACNCKAEPVIKQLNANMCKKGYPDHTATSLLAGLHDMNESLEKAAIRRLATHEHNTLTAQHEFEHKVLWQLHKLSQCLPTCHPTRTKANLTILRKA